MKIFVARVFKNIPLNVKNIKVKFLMTKRKGYLSFAIKMTNPPNNIIRHIIIIICHY